jgi:hypothetical protein
MMTGPDDQMDQIGDKRKPVNKLPVKCNHCTFPDLDFVTNPYLLGRGISSPAETSPAGLGNFLVRERVRRILELVVPNACTFHPTADVKSKKTASWWLAVPNVLLNTEMPKAKPPFCSKCGESKVWGPLMGPVWDKMKDYNSGGVDIFKSVSWFSRITAEDEFEQTNNYRKKNGEAPLAWYYSDVEPPSHPERWTRKVLDRELYFSVRLEQLLKRAKVKGQLVRLLMFNEVKPSMEDIAWIEDKMQLLVEHGLADVLKTTNAAQKWFKQFVKRNARKKNKGIDFVVLEKQHKLTLPQDYKDFITTVGEKIFTNVNGLEGITTTVLPPTKLNFKDYRRNKVPYLEGEQAEIDGVMFASMDNGNAFVFDISAKGSDYPVFWYDHEGNALEPFAPNFAECIKRFAQKN